jgi:CheY-like chemotaxis protein
MNLVINAGDAMPDGGKLIIETTNVELDETYVRDHADLQPGAFVQLSVSDTGHGIEFAQIPHIFEPFFTTKAKGKGTGLGLATVYGIVKQHGGHISVYSEPGRGTTFRLYFPRVDAPLSVAPKDVPLPPVSAAQTKILVVEDDERVRALLASALSARGYDVSVAAGPREALQMVADPEAVVDLLVTDVIMPELNGPELYRKLAAQIPNLKVLYISGYTDEAIAERGMLEPGVNFFQKPFTVHALNRKIYEILSR